MTTFMIPIPVNGLIADSEKAIDDIRTASGLQERHFELFCMPLINAFAANVQQFPLSKTHYRDERGAWNFGLLASMVAYRFASSQMFFPTMESEERRVIEPQCRFIAFAATLATAVAILAQNAKITAKQDEYHPLIASVSLQTWLEKHPSPNFSWRTVEKPLTAGEAAAIAARFIPTGLLSNFDVRVSLMLFNSIAPQNAANGIETTLSKVVRLSISKVLEQQQLQETSRFQDREPTPTNSLGLNLADELSSTTKPQTESSLSSGSNNHASSNTTSAGAPAQQHDDISSDDLLKKADPVLREWFAALPAHERYPALKDKLVVTERGVTVPATMLGFFGVNAPTVRNMMEKAGMVIGRSEDQRGLILHPSLKHLLIVEAG